MGLNSKPQTQLEYFKARGIKTRADAQRPAEYVGSRARKTFSQIADVMETRFVGSATDVAVLGEVYESGFYRATIGSQEKSYEPVFGELDWTMPAQDPTTARALDEIFGNNDNDPTGEAGELTESELRSVLGKGTTENNVRDQKERFRALYAAQNGTSPVQDEDTTGIRGVEDIDAPIEPFA